MSRARIAPITIKRTRCQLLKKWPTFALCTKGAHFLRSVVCSPSSNNFWSWAPREKACHIMSPWSWPRVWSNELAEKEEIWWCQQRPNSHRRSRSPLSLSGVRWRRWRRVCIRKSPWRPAGLIPPDSFISETTKPSLLLLAQSPATRSQQYARWLGDNRRLLTMWSDTAHCSESRMSGEGQNLELDDYIVKKYEVKKRIGKGVSHTPVVYYSD
jgi:hypothetical protein